MKNKLKEYNENLKTDSYWSDPKFFKTTFEDFLFKKNRLFN